MNNDFKDIIDKIPQPLKEGDTAEGKIIGVGRSSIFLDLSPFGTGIVYGREFISVKDNVKKLKKGEKLRAKVVSPDNEDGFIELSLREAAEQSAWKEIEKIKNNDVPVKVKIIGANRGGLLTKLFNIPAFIPSSQLNPENYPKIKNPDSSKILRELQKLVGKELEVKVLDFYPKTGKLILSEKEGASQLTERILKNYRVGDIVEGEVTALMDFGAFVKFWKKPKKKNEEMEGLIHISEIDWQIVTDPSQILKVGQKLKAKIIDIDKGKVYLSLKALKENPWRKIEGKYKRGDIIKGEVKRIRPYGAFIEVEPGIYGLCHISEFGSSEKIKEEIEEGKNYKFKITSFLPQENKMTLSLAK